MHAAAVGAVVPARVRAKTVDLGWRRAAGAAAIVAVLWCAAFIAWQLLGSPSQAQAALVGDLAPMLPMVMVVGLALRAAWIAPDRRTTGAWTLIALAFSADFAATIGWAWLELVRHVTPWPSLTDVGYLGFYPLLLLGLLRLSGPRRDAGERIRVGLDIATVFLASAMAVWYFALGPAARGADLLSPATILALAYPVGDLVIVFGVITLLLRGAICSSTAVLRLLTVGCIATVVGDIGFANLSLSDDYRSGDWPDAFWMVAVMLVVVGLASECRFTHSSSSGVVSPDLTHPSRVARLPYIAIVVAFAFALAVSWETVDFPLDGILLAATAITATVVLRQVTAMRDNLRLNEELHILATTDPLTALANRRHFLELTEARLQAGGGEEMCLIMADLDHFKSINDTYGHAVGDEALSWVARHCLATLPASAVVGRLGGDEFVALLPGEKLAEAVVLAEQLVASIAATVRPVPGGPEHLSVSLGVASSHDCSAIAGLLSAADGALYDAKRAGRGRASASVIIPAVPARPELEVTPSRRRTRG